MTGNDKTLEQAYRELGDAARKALEEIVSPLPTVPSTRQHVIVIGSLLIAIGVLIWLSYFGPLS